MTHITWPAAPVQPKPCRERCCPKDKRALCTRERRDPQRCRVARPDMPPWGLSRLPRRPEGKRKPAKAPPLCQRCGNPITGVAMAWKYCMVCREQVMRQTRCDYYRRRNAERKQAKQAAATSSQARA